MINILFSTKRVWIVLYFGGISNRFGKYYYYCMESGHKMYKVCSTVYPLFLNKKVWYGFRENPHVSSATTQKVILFLYHNISIH